MLKWSILMKPSNRIYPQEGYRMDIDMMSIEYTERRKPEKHGCFPCAKMTLCMFSLFILNAQLKNEFYSATNIVSRILISKYLYDNSTLKKYTLV